MHDFTDERAPYEIPLEAYGVEIRVCADSEELLAKVEPLLPPGWRRCRASPVQHRLGIILEDDGTYTVYNGQASASRGQGLELSLVVLDIRIRGYIALNSPDRVFVHAGAVAHDGRAIVLPGHSFVGKTTLVAALVRAGATYYSDEFAVLDSDGLVHPYAKPLSVSDDPHRPQVGLDVSHFGGVAGEDPMPLGLVVVTYFRPGAEWRPERITSGAAALALLGNTVPVQSRSEQAMQAVTRALADATALEGPRGEADAVAAQLLDVVPAERSTIGLTL